ncbi:hypothetical protein PIB30_011856 [Stylosanthes scabra]|uniref:Uncharacterized protein n=1 Tax=Stylosanthes scabra TaxID=79078 RepID=A0ABU6T5T4_9FABA|nr:hypothetical protein [Stylosanthes scabra]
MNASNSALNLGKVGSMEEDVESHQRAAAAEHPMAESFFVDPILFDEEFDREILSEAEVVAEMNYFTDSLIAFTQPTISERYDCSTHFSSLNLDAMNEHVSHRQRAPDDDPTSEFDVSQEFQLRHPTSAIRVLQGSVEDTTRNAPATGGFTSEFFPPVNSYRRIFKFTSGIFR